MNNDLIAQALVELGFNSGWVVTGDTLDGIDWIDTPTTKPTDKEIIDMIAKLPSIQDAKLAAEATKKQALLNRLGITADELKTILG